MLTDYYYKTKLPTNHTCRFIDKPACVLITLITFWLFTCEGSIALTYKLWCFTFHTGTRRKRARRVPGGNTPIQEAILHALHRHATTPPTPKLSEDAQFLNSLLPSLERLPRQACAELKFEIHKLVVEATRRTNLEPI